MKVEIRDSKSNKLLFTFAQIPDAESISFIKARIHQQNGKLNVHRQSLRSTPSGKDLNDDKKLADLGETTSLKLFLRDLGPQVGWRTVFLTEYTGPLVVYLCIWLLRQPFLPNPLLTPINSSINLRRLAMVCYCGHYVKRLLETLFVHRFSHATMPLRNLFKNCIYYYGFTAFVGYFVNHPLYTPPRFGHSQICIGLAMFMLSEWGNFSCHLALKNLRPPGSTVRKIPNAVPGYFMTRLFHLVACPHYTYEALSWSGFTIMTQTLPAGLFTLVGFLQMSTWAKARLNRYRREFPDFPRERKAIVPFIY